MSRLTVAMPKARDGRDREPTIPASVLAKRAAAASAAAGGAMDVEGGEGAGAGAGVQPARKTEKDLMWENGGPGVYSCDYRKYYDLKARGRGGGRRLLRVVVQRGLPLARWLSLVLVLVVVVMVVCVSFSYRRLREGCRVEGVGVTDGYQHLDAECRWLCFGVFPRCLRCRPWVYPLGWSHSQYCCCWRRRSGADVSLLWVRVLLFLG